MDSKASLERYRYARREASLKQYERLMKPASSSRLAFRSYSLVDVWLKTCEDDTDRGRDQRNYTMFSDVLKKNGYLRVDSVLKQLSVRDLLDMTAQEGVQVTHGLASSVLLYAREDVDRIAKRGKF